MTFVRRLIARVLPQGAVLLSVLTFGSYVLGLLRDRLFARTFGAGADLDAYNAAFVLPELTLDVLIAGGLAAPFIPLFAALKREDVAAAHDFARTILTGAVLVMGIAAALLFVFGSGPIKGFAVTLSIGLLTSMFTAITVTRLMIITWLRHARPKMVPI